MTRSCALLALKGSLKDEGEAIRFSAWPVASTGSMRQSLPSAYSLIKAADERGGERDGREEGCGAAVLAGGGG